MTMDEQLDLFGSIATPAAPPPKEQASGHQEPSSPRFADTELDAALETLTQYSIETIIRRVISLEAAELLARLRSMSEQFSRTELKERKDQIAQLQQEGCITVTYRKGKRVGIELKRERIIELARETDERLERWAKGEFACLPS
jgi:hypothetical protein